MYPMRLERWFREWASASKGTASHGLQPMKMRRLESEGAVPGVLCRGYELKQVFQARHFTAS